MAKKPAAKKPAKNDLLAEVARRAMTGEAPLTAAEIAGEVEGDEPEDTHSVDAVVVPERIPTPDEPGFINALIIKMIDAEGDVNKALRSMRCTFSDYLAVSSTSEFKTAYDNIVAAKVDIPNRLAARMAVTETAKEGNAYALKTLHDTRQGDSISEEDQRALSELRMADRRTLGRQLEHNLRRIIGMLEVVRGRRYSLVEHEADGNEPTILEPTVADIAADIAQPYIHSESAADGE